MFIGHYGLGLAGKSIDKTPSLGTLFLAVQWLDLIWPLFVLGGVERFSIDPGNTVLTPISFDSYPWSHSMLMAMAWSLLFGIVYFVRTHNNKVSILLALLVFSHWLLDFITHRPDLQLTPFAEQRVGLGLWNYKWAEIIIEVLLFGIGAFIYLQKTKAKNKAGTRITISLLLFLFIIHIMNIAGPPPPGTKVVAWMALSQWLLVAWGYWADRHRL